MSAQTVLIVGNGGDDATGTWLGGKNWDTNVTDNPNVMTDGSITLDAPAGTWAFKVVSIDEDGYQSWLGTESVDFENSSEGVSGNDNITFYMPQAGQITVSFDGELITVVGDCAEYKIDVYTLLGDSTIFGTQDDPTNSANDMIANGDGTYTKVYENVLLPVGEFGFKVVGNHAYSAYEYPYAYMYNYIQNVDADGLYNITFTFNPNEPNDSENKLTYELEYVGAMPEEPENPDVTYPVYLVAGNGNDDPTGTWLSGFYWSFSTTDNPNIMTDGSVTLYAPEGTWAFKVVAVDEYGISTWYGMERLDTLQSSPGIYGSDNIQVYMKQPGDITVSFNGESIVVKGDFSQNTIDTYTLIGDSIIFGTQDDVTNTANDMISNGDGTYTKVYENVLLPVGEFGFKVVGNHAYSAYEYPAAWMYKYIYNLDAEGFYNITFTFDTNELDDSDNKLTYELEYVGAMPEEPEEPEEIPETLIFFDESSMLYYLITSDSTVAVIPTQNEDVPYSGDIVVPNQIYRYGNRYDVTAIHDKAFRTNNNTYSITLPESLVSIGRNVFPNTISFIELPGNVADISEYAFQWAYNLSAINVSLFNENYASHDGVLYTKDSTELLHYPSAKRDTSFVLPFGNKVITKGAIDNSYIKEITLCKTLTSIENSNYMPNVTKIIANPVLPPMVKNVATFPFEAELVVNGHMELYLNDEYWSNFLDSKRIYFKNTAAFDSVYVHCWKGQGSEYSTIYPGKKMQPVEGQKDWYYCDILPLTENVIFSAGGLTYENHADRTKTADIVLDDANPYFIYSTGSWVSSFDQKGDTTLSYQFNDDGTATLVADADYKFRGEFNIPSTITRDGKTYSVTQIAAEAFCGTFSTVIRIPQSIKSVGKDAFNYGYRHKHRIYYEGTIADWCAIEFANLKSIPQTIEHSELWIEGKLLQDLYLPSTVKSIGNYAFANYNLRSVNLSGQLESIGESSFEGCTNLRTVILGENITSMGSKAFYNASGVTEVYANMPTPPVFNQFFGGDDVNLSLIKLYVPEKYVRVYQSMDGWKEFDIVPLVDEEITDDQVHTKPSINSVVIQWPAVQEADTYTINIWIDVDQTELICSLVFNKYGMLVNITFERNAVDADLKGFSHIITGLDANQTYFYSVETKDEEDNIIDTQVGDFVTIDIPTSIQDVADNITLTASNGRIDANADFTIYNVLGKNVTSHNGHLKGVYIVSINDERYKILVP